MKPIFSHLRSATAYQLFVLTLAVSAFSQAGSAGGESSGMGLSVLLIAIVALGGVGFLLWRRSQSAAAATAEAEAAMSEGDDFYNDGSYDVGNIDEDLALFRKPKKPRTPKLAQNPKTGSPDGSASAPLTAPGVRAYGRATGIVDIDTRAFQEKMRKIQYAQLPINSFLKLRPAKLYEPLPYSDDPSLLSAIEQAGEEYEEDESVRELAARILAAFRTRNSVESLSQLALYDLSSNIRSKAVSTLTEFDHPSVFEAILLACADPTREVRAAAARGLFKLSFDRSDAWKRLADTNDEYRMRHAARAAIESGIAVKSFERLVHEDLKVAQEAFALVAFMIAADETNEVFEAIRSHKDERIRFALLHVLKVQKDERTSAKVLELRRLTTLSPDVTERVKETLASLPVAVVT